MNYWLLILGQIATVGALLYYFFTQKLSYWKNRGLNGPKALPFYGNEWEMLWKGQQKTELEWYRKYGTVYGTYSNKGEPTLTIVDPELVKQVMVKDFSSFVNRALFPGGGNTNKMLFFLENEHWKRVRAITSPAFTSGKLKGMNPLMDICVNRLMSYFEAVSKNGEPIDTKRVISGFTIDVIASTSFGIDANSNTAERDFENPFVKAATETFRFNLLHAYLSHITPMWLMKLIHKLKAVLSGKKGTSGGGFFGDVTQEVVKQRRETGRKRNDFIDLLLNARVSEEELKNSSYEKLEASDEKEDESTQNSTSTYSTSHGKIVKKLDDDEIMAQMMIFFIAGFETTASTISHMLFELASNPDVQERLVEELTEGVEGLKADSDAYYDVVMHKLNYLDAVVKETLRKYPPLNRVERRTGVEGYKLGGVTLRKEQMVYVSVYALHHNPDYFPEPEKFNPERFLPENKDSIVPYSYLPFGQGPRNCVGMRFALQEIKICLAKVMAQYKFSVTPKTPKELTFAPIGLMNVQPFELKVTRR